MIVPTALWEALRLFHVIFFAYEPAHRNNPSSDTGLKELKDRTMILMLALLAWPQLATPSCRLVEGIGADFAQLGGASADRKGSLPKHISLQYENDVLVRIFIFQENCRTSKGIKIGDSETEVRTLYGEGKKTRPSSLTGRAPASFEKAGDWIYEYPGVCFLIHEGKVVEFVIQGIQS